MSVVVSLLWPKHHAVLPALAKRGIRVFAVLPSWASEALVTGLAAEGAQLYNLEHGISRQRAGELIAEAQHRAEAIAPVLAPQIETEEVMRHGGTRGHLARVVQQSLVARLLESMRLIEALHALHAMRGVRAVLVNDAETLLAKSALLWAANNVVPSFLISHGVNVNPPYSLVSRTYSDYITVFGEKSVLRYLEMGARREQIGMTGNPAWDPLAAMAGAREPVRASVYSANGLRPDDPLAVFAPTWMAGLSTMNPPETYDQTLLAFFRAMRALRERGITCNVVVKGRPTNGEVEAGWVAELARAAGFADYRFATGDLLEFIAAADVLVGFESNAFIEAMLLGTPCVNVWAPQTWLLGPAFEPADGIPHVSHEEPAELANVIGAILRDESYRCSLVQRLRARADAFSYANDAKSTERTAAFIASHLARE